jgi:urease accessory protein
MHLSKPHWDGNYLTINAVNSTAGLFAGDRIEISARACRGARVVLTSPSASRVFRAKDSRDEARIDQSFFVEAGGRLDLFPEMLIPHAGSRYSQKTRIEVDPQGELLLTEMIAPGRFAAGEAFDYDRLRLETDLSWAGRLVVRESACLGPKLETVRAIRERFPGAYFATFFVAWGGAGEKDFCRAIAGLTSARVSAGASSPAAGIQVVKLIAADSVSLRGGVTAIRKLAYACLGWPPSSLRKL